MSYSDVKIRKAEISDLEEIYQIEVECFPEDAFTPLFIKKLIEDSNSIFLVATLNEHVAGFIVGTLEKFRGKTVGHIYSIDVKSEYRGKGIGSFLLKSIEEALRKIGVKECYLEVRVDNMVARNLYFKFGYRVFQILKNYYGVGKDGILLMKRLDTDSEAHF